MNGKPERLVPHRPRPVPEPHPFNPGEEPAVTVDLTESERHEAETRSALRAVVVHEAIRIEGDEELKRSGSALAWSGLAAGLSMGFSLVTEGLLRAAIPDVSWRPLISKFGYSVGFLIVVLGRQQLFTENTLTVIIPLLVRRNLSTFVAVLRLWGIVLAANLVGAAVFAFAVGRTDVFRPEVKDAFEQLGREAMKPGFGSVVLAGIFAGWLIALMVWLLPFGDSERLPIIIIITYIVGLGGFAHIIAGSVEVLYLVVTGVISFGQYVSAYLVPTFIGNTVGGVSLVAALNHAQVVAGEKA